MNLRSSLTLIVSLTLAGCVRQPPPPAPALRAMGQSVSVEEEHTDEAIGLEIRKRLQTEAPADTAGVIVNISNGVVTLEGSVPTLEAGWRAQAAANAVKGVKRVVSKLIVTAIQPGSPLP